MSRKGFRLQSETVYVSLSIRQKKPRCSSMLKMGYSEWKYMGNQNTSTIFLNTLFPLLDQWQAILGHFWHLQKHNRSNKWYLALKKVKSGPICLSCIQEKSGALFFQVMPFVARLFPGQTVLDYFKQVHIESLGNWQKDKRKRKIVRELKSGERSSFGNSPYAWRHFGYISIQTQTHTHVRDLLKWEVSSRSKRETSERFAIKNTSVGKNVTRTLVKKKKNQNKTRPTACNIYHKEQGQAGLSYKDCPKIRKVFEMWMTY